MANLYPPLSIHRVSSQTPRFPLSHTPSRSFLSRSRTIHLVWRVPRAMSETRVPRNVCLDRIFLRGCEIATADIIQGPREVTFHSVKPTLSACSSRSTAEIYSRVIDAAQRNEREKSEKLQNTVSSFVQVGRMNFVCSNLRWKIVRIFKLIRKLLNENGISFIWTRRGTLYSGNLLIF